ncbi:MAG: PHP domain-containing protein [Anaerolineae bacterium]
MIEPLHAHVEPIVVPVGESSSFRLVADAPSVTLPPGQYQISVKNKRSGHHNALITVSMNQEGMVAFDYAAPISGECYVDVSFPSGYTHRAGSFFLAEKELAVRLPLRGDMHVHTWYSDGVSSPLDAVARAHNLGLDFVAITDHNNWAGSVEGGNAAERLGLPTIVLLGEEVSFERGHIVAVATSSGVAEARSAPTYEQELKSIMAELTSRRLESGLLPADYAQAVWAARKVHSLGGLAFVAHPFWVHADEFHLDRRVARQLLLDGEVDGIELLGEVEFEDNMLAIACYMELLQQGLITTVVGNSDTHGLQHTYGSYWSTVFARERSQAGLLAALREGYSVACVHLPGEQLRIYGPLPLVEYAYFLHRRFFPARQQRLWP